MEIFAILNAKLSTVKEEPMKQKDFPLKTAHVAGVLWAIFCVYLIMLVRITLLKSAPLYNLFAAIGTGTPGLQLLPVASAGQLLEGGMSMGALIGNFLGNVLIFVPMGLLLPGLLKVSYGKALCYGLGTSLFIEAMQYFLSAGVADVDDVLLNMVGMVLGLFLHWLLCQKLPTRRAVLAAMTAGLTVFGLLSSGVLFFTNHDLFRLSRPKVTVENAVLVQPFIETAQTYGGSFVTYAQPYLTIALSGNRNKGAEQQLLLTEDGKVFLCHDEITYFLKTVSAEHLRYEPLAANDFDARLANLKQGLPVRVWSKNGTTIDHVVFYLVSEKP